MRILVSEFLSSGGLARHTGGASLAREGLAMLRAVLSDVVDCAGVEAATLVLPELEPLLPRHPHLHCEIVTPETESVRFRMLARQCSHALVIAPEFDDILARRAGWAVEAGAKLLGPTPEAIRATADKLRLGELLQKEGIATPRTLPWSAGPCPFPFPVVVKPRDGAGAVATFLVPDETDYIRCGDRARDEGFSGELLVQPAFWGTGWTPASVSFLLGPSDCLPMPICRQLITLEEGRISYSGGEFPAGGLNRPDVVDLALRAVRAVEGLRGYVGVDLALSDEPNTSQIIEINPRLTTSYVGLRRLVRGNLLRAMLGIAEGNRRLPLDFSGEAVTFKGDGTLIE